MVGEARRLGVGVSATSVGTILRRHGLGPAPRRSREGPSWVEFWRVQAAGTLATDRAIIAVLALRLPPARRVGMLMTPGTVGTGVWWPSDGPRRRTGHRVGHRLPVRGSHRDRLPRPGAPGVPPRAAPSHARPHAPGRVYRRLDAPFTLQIHSVSRPTTGPVRGLRPAYTGTATVTITKKNPSPADDTLARHAGNSPPPVRITNEDQICKTNDGSHRLGSRNTFLPG